MTKEIIDHITDPEVIRAWAHLTLVERCTQIQIKFGVKLHRQTLSSWYHRNQIVKTKPQFKFLGHLKLANLKEE